MSDKLQKIVEELSSLTIIEAAELAKLLEETWGVSAAAAVAVAAGPAAGGASAAAEEKTEFDIELTDAGAEKIKVIKELRALMPELGLADAKALADGAPKVVKSGASKEDAAKFKEKLEAAGAKVAIK